MRPMPSGNSRQTSSVTPGRMVGLIMPTTPRQLENAMRGPFADCVTRDVVLFQRCARRSEPYFLMNAIMVATAFTEFGSNGCSLTKVWRAPS